MKKMKIGIEHMIIEKNCEIVHKNIRSLCKNAEVCIGK